MVGVNAWVIHYDKSIWGDDVDAFRPERWLVSKDQLAIMDQHFLAVRVSSLWQQRKAILILSTVWCWCQDLHWQEHIAP